MSYSQTRLERALDFAPRTTLAGTAVTAEALGPGELSTWKLYRRGDQKCWTQKEAMPAISRKRKVIISHGLLDRVLRDSELSLISDLIENYDVIFGWETMFLFLQ